jgi:hypothetical protein
MQAKKFQMKCYVDKKKTNLGNFNTVGDSDQQETNYE